MRIPVTPYTRPRRTPIRDWIERTLTAGDGRGGVMFSLAVYVIAVALSR